MADKGKINIPDSCPHCGYKLTPWQQVLLKVDKALVCKNCWYRIILEVKEENITDKEKPLKKNTEDK